MFLNKCYILCIYESELQFLFEAFGFYFNLDFANVWHERKRVISESVNEHLAEGVVTNLSERFVASQEGSFQKCHLALKSCNVNPTKI